MIDFQSTCISDEQFLRRRSFDRTLNWDADLPSDLVERMWHDPHSLLAMGQKLQDKPRCTVVRLDHPAGSFVFKYHNWGGSGRTLRKSLSRASAKASWIDGRYLLAAGIPTPRPRACAQRRLGPLGICSYLLTDYVAGTTLYRLMRFERPSSQVVLDLARQVAAIWQQLDDLRVSHNDLKAENLLVDLEGRVWLIDLEKMRRHRRQDETRRRQVRDAGDLLHPRSWRTNPAAAEVFRRQILQTPGAAETTAGPDGATHPLNRPLPPINRSSQLITVVIPCRNDAHAISACLESVRDIADEILVADTGSTDETLDIVRETGGCRIIRRDSAEDADFENKAHDRARHSWILRIMPNERLNPDLARQVQDLLAAEPADDGFRVTRTYCFRGHPIKFGESWHDFPVRLYRKGAGHYVMREGRVELIIPSGKIGSIFCELFCETGRSIDQSLNEMARLAAQTAENAQRQGLRPKCRAVLWRVPWQFFRSYVLRWGWLDGWAGLHSSCLSAFAVYLSEAKLWEMYQFVTFPRRAAPDRRQTLQIFDPDGSPDVTVLSTDGLFTPPVEESRVENTVDQRQKRFAA